MLSDLKHSSQTNDQQAESKKKSINIEPGQQEIVIKYLASKDNNSGFKIDLIPSDSAAIVTCSLNSSHPITIEDLLIGDRIENASISANGDYAIITGRIVFKYGNNEYYKKLYDIRKSTFTGDVSNKKDINWMPS